MRHLVKKSKLNKATSHRNAMLRNLAAQVIQYEHIQTTEAKAKAVSPIIDKLIGIGKKNDLIARRRLHKELYDELAIKKILEILITRYKDRTSGFTSMVKLRARAGDNAKMVQIMLIEAE